MNAKTNSNNIALSSLSYIVIVLLILIFSGRLLNIYIEHDDWDFMVPREMALYASSWSKTLSEGRWITYVWSIFATYIPYKYLGVIFFSGYALLSYSMASILTKNNIFRVIIALSFFLCPTYSSLSTWPATSTPSVYIASLFIFLMPFAKNALPIYTGFTAFIFSLLYPPLGAIVLIFSSTLSINKKTLVIICASYFLGFMLGIGTIYSLNYNFHGTFGIIPEEWRNTHKINNIADLEHNIKKAIESVLYISKWYYLEITSIIAAATYLFFTNKKKIINILIVVCFVFSLDLLIIVYSGTDISERYFLWPWFLLLLLFGVCLQDAKENSVKRIVLSLIFSFYIAYGLFNWFSDAIYYTEAARDQEYIGVTMNNQRRNHIITCGSPKYVSNQSMTMMMYKEYDIILSIGDEATCKNIKDYGVSILDNIVYYKYY